MLPSTGLLIYWLYPIHAIPVFANSFCIDDLSHCFSRIFLILFFSPASGTLYHSSVRLFVSFDIYQILLCAFLISFHFLLNMTASGFLTFSLPFISMSSYCQPSTSQVLSSYTISFTTALTCLSEKQGTHSCTRRWPSQTGEGWQAKEFFLQHNWVLQQSPRLFLQFLTFSSTGSQVFLLRTLEISLSLSFLLGSRFADSYSTG